MYIYIYIYISTKDAMVTMCRKQKDLPRTLVPRKRMQQSVTGHMTH